MQYCIWMLVGVFGGWLLSDSLSDAERKTIQTLAADAQKCNKAYLKLEVEYNDARDAYWRECGNCK